MLSRTGLNARFKEFNSRPATRLRIELSIAWWRLCAPRPVLIRPTGRDDTWINPEGQFEVLRARGRVYHSWAPGDLHPLTQPS